MTDSIKDAGIAYIQKNISIIPVNKNKVPLIKWSEFQERRATVEEFEQWLKEYPDMQIGIVTGAISGLIVVDIDDPKIDLSWLPETVIVKTGSGGFHYYYSYTEAFKNKARIKESIDIRADGGYVVAPPSHNLKGKYEIVKKTICQPFPINLFIKDKVNETYTKVETEYTGFGKGQRNDEMTKYIGHLLAKVHPSEWDNIAWNIAKEANQKNTPPLSENELKNIFNSIAGKERNNTTERWYKKKENNTINLTIKKDYKSRYTWGTGGLDNNFAIIKRGNFIVIGAKQSQGKTTFTFDMACKNALLGHNVLYLSLEMEGSILKDDIGRKYAGITIPEEYYYNIPEHKQIAYKRKLDEIESIENLYFKSLRRGDSPTWNNIVKIINEYKDLDLIFIDNLDLIEGEVGENNIDRQKRITKRIMNFTTEYNIPIILIHHHRKTSGKDYGADELTGSGKIKDNADIILKITRNDDPDAEYPEKYISRIHQQKGRGYPEQIRDIYFIKGTFEDEAPTLETYTGISKRTDYFNN